MKTAYEKLEELNMLEHAETAFSEEWAARSFQDQQDVRFYYEDIKEEFFEDYLDKYLTVSLN